MMKAALLQEMERGGNFRHDEYCVNSPELACESALRT